MSVSRVSSLISKFQNMAEETQSQPKGRDNTKVRRLSMERFGIFGRISAAAPRREAKPRAVRRLSVDKTQSTDKKPKLVLARRKSAEVLRAAKPAKKSEAATQPKMTIVEETAEKIDRAQVIDIDKDIAVIEDNAEPEIQQSRLVGRAPYDKPLPLLPEERGRQALHKDIQEQKQKRTEQQHAKQLKKLEKIDQQANERLMQAMGTTIGYNFENMSGQMEGRRIGMKEDGRKGYKSKPITIGRKLNRAKIDELAAALFGGQGTTTTTQPIAAAAAPPPVEKKVEAAQVMPQAAQVIPQAAEAKPLTEEAQTTNTALLNGIQNVNLRQTEVVERPVDPRAVLMASIREGRALNHVEAPTAKKPAANKAKTLIDQVQSFVAGRPELRNAQDDEESDFSDDDWS